MRHARHPGLRRPTAGRRLPKRVFPGSGRNLFGGTGDVCHVDPDPDKYGDQHPNSNQHFHAVADADAGHKRLLPVAGVVRPARGRHVPWRWGTGVQRELFRGDLAVHSLHSDADQHPDRNPHTNPNSDEYANRHTDVDTHFDPNSDRHHYADPHVHADSDADSDLHADARGKRLLSMQLLGSARVRIGRERYVLERLRPYL